MLYVMRMKSSGGKEAMKNFRKIVDCIGHTPLLHLCNKYNAADIWGKLEFFSPMSSIKDRPAWNIVRRAQESGMLRPGGTLVEATSGNMGIGLAMAAIAADCRLILTMPESMSIERRALITHLGAEVVLTPAAEGMAGAVAKAEEIALSMTGAYLTKQFENPANPEAHRPGNLGRFRRQSRYLRGRSRHWWDHYRRRAIPEGKKSAYSHRRRRTRRIGRPDRASRR